ncbi:MAG: hypothetical protein R3Y11_01355 [Pseudomonadota bacterium]
MTYSLKEIAEDSSKRNEIIDDLDSVFRKHDLYGDNAAVACLYALNRQIGLETLPKSQELIVKIGYVCGSHASWRGVFKRIDENREILQFLQEHAPEVLERFGCIESWLAGNDKFFVDLANALEIEQMIGIDGNFPRPWTGSFPMDDAYINFTDISFNAPYGVAYE